MEEGGMGLRAAGRERRGLLVKVGLFHEYIWFIGKARGVFISGG